MKASSDRTASILSLAELPPRLAEVLVAVLRRYIGTGLAIGSRDMVEEAGLSISPATARAAMAELMEFGLLEQAHPSAGRVPTDAAFRAWASQLLSEPDSESESVLPGRFARELVEHEASPERALRRAADALSELTGQLGFSVAREPEHTTLAELRLVRVSSDRVMALLICETGAVRSRLIDERESDSRRLDRISSTLSRLVAGLTLGEARARLASEIEGERNSRDALWSKTVALGQLGLDIADAVDPALYVSDRSRLLDQPEFGGGAQLRAVLHALEEKQRMLAVLDKVLLSDGVRVVIGDELGDPGVARCAVVAEKFPATPLLGGVGVIGPVRMRYDRVIPVVRLVSGTVATALG